MGANEDRLTILSWYISLDKDGVAEIAESSTFKELSQAYRDIMPARNSPSGFANRYGAVLYPFPTAVQVSGLGVISDSLVGRVRLDSPELNIAKEQLILSLKEELESHFED